MSENTHASDAISQIDHSGRAGSGLSFRSVLVLVLLALVTVSAVVLVWLWPDESLWHFVWVTQVLPLGYCLLAYWGSDAD